LTNARSLSSPTANAGVKNMRLAKVSLGGRIGLAVQDDGLIKAIFGDETLANLDGIVARGIDALKSAGETVRSRGETVSETDLVFLPPLVKAPKIICLGLNYKDHAAEGGFRCRNSPPSSPGSIRV
jgi:acylpyruvate hydrolase